MKICHLSTAHQAFDTRIFHKECKSLARAGYEVVFLVPHDRQEKVEGVRVQPIPKPPNHLERMTRTVFHLFQSAWREDAAIYHFHDPEIIPAGILLALLGKRVIYDVHEDFPETFLVDERDWIKPQIARLLSKYLAFMEWLGARWFFEIITVTPTIARRFPNSKTVLIQNFPISDELVSRSTPYQGRSAIIAYLGGMTRLRGIREMVSAMESVPDVHKAHLHLAGRFEMASVQEEISRLPGWQRVTFWGMQDRRGVASLLGQARMGLVLLHPIKRYMVAQPIKLYEYMTAGIPVIVSDFPLWRKIVEGAGCGLVVDPLDPGAIARAITWLLEHPQEAEAMGKRGQMAVRQRYNWDAEAAKLLAMYQKILS